MVTDFKRWRRLRFAPKKMLMVRAEKRSACGGGGLVEPNARSTLRRARKVCGDDGIVTSSYMQGGLSAERLV
jgi:hypothetical protein